MTHKIVNLQVVAFDDFKRLSTGTSLADVKVNATIIFIFLGCAFIPMLAGCWEVASRRQEL
jgi:hypothetical protein